MDISTIFSLGKALTFDRLSVKDSDAKKRGEASVTSPQNVTECNKNIFFG